MGNHRADPARFRNTTNGSMLGCATETIRVPLSARTPPPFSAWMPTFFQGAKKSHPDENQGGFAIRGLGVKI